MTGDPDVTAKIDGLLARLGPTATDGSGRRTVTGRAVGRDNDTVHLQLATSRIKVRIDAITGVVQSEGDPLLVTLQVEAADAIEAVATPIDEPAAGPHASAIAFPGRQVGGSFGSVGVHRLPEIVLCGAQTATMSTVTFESQADASDADMMDSVLDN